MKEQSMIKIKDQTMKIRDTRAGGTQTQDQWRDRERQREKAQFINYTVSLGKSCLAQRIANATSSAFSQKAVSHLSVLTASAQRARKLTQD